MYTQITLLFVGVNVRKACLQQVEFSEQKLLMIKHLLNERISVNSSAVNSTDLFINYFSFIFQNIDGHQKRFTLLDTCCYIKP